MKMMRVKVILLLAATAQGSFSGEMECPCITSSSALYAGLTSDLVASGLPMSYGTQGCEAYDNETNYTTNCLKNSEEYCLHQWCYVDMTMCPKDKQLCEAAGGKLGSDVSPYCRTRPNTMSSLYDATLPYFYSYETCGFKNKYNKTKLYEPIVDHVMKVQLLESSPWLFKREDGTTWSGPLYDFFTESLKHFAPAPALNHETGRNRSDGTGAYPACVDDVAVGNVDVCVADLWVLPERYALVFFLPALRYDLFYLVVEKKGLENVSFLTRLQRPFVPFTLGGWMAILAFLCGFATVLWLIRLVEKANEAHAAPEEEKAIKAKSHCFGIFGKGGRRGEAFTDYGNTCFEVWNHFFSQGMVYEDPDHPPAYRLMSLAFVFFSLVTLATYTASLATFLIVEKSPVGGVANIQEAIQNDFDICVPTALKPLFSQLYSKGTFVECSQIEDCPKLMHAGNCKAMILSQQVIDRLHAGEIKEDDEDIGRDDCKFLRVGDVPLWSIPIAFPVASSMAHGLSWSFTQSLATGVMEEMKLKHSRNFPENTCQASSETEQQALSFWDLSGTIFVTMILMGLAALRLVLRTCCCSSGLARRPKESKLEDSEIKRPAAAWQGPLPCSEPHAMIP